VTVEKRLLSIGLLVSSIAFALPRFAVGQEAGGERPEVLPRDEEFDLALSAAPEHLRAGAAVYVLAPEGYELAREGTNGFACIVNRDHPRNLKPTCYDSEGVATILPKVVYVGELLLRGLPIAAIQDSVRAGFESGRFRAPARPGVAYMLSKRIRTYNPRTGEYGTFPPHLMFYAPNLTNDDIATDWKAIRRHPWLPRVAYQGPHGFMIVVVGDSVSGSAAEAH
jgi:hypothetical protein